LEIAGDGRRLAAKDSRPRLAGGVELGGVEGGLVSFGGEFFFGKGLGRQIAALGQLLGEFQLVHVDAPGQAEEASGDAVAVDGSAFGADLLLLSRAIDGAANRVFGELGEAFHFVGYSQATGQDQLVALVGEPSLGREALVMIEAAVLAGLCVGLPALDALDDAGDSRLVDAEEGGDARLRFALHFGELVDEELIAGGLIGLMLAGRGHGGLLERVRVCTE
jgi:hypothetical protein